MKPLVVIGAGGFGRETLDVVQAINADQESPIWGVLGVVDDNPSDLTLSRLAARHVSWLGTLSDWIKTEPESDYVVAVGNPQVRKVIVQRLQGNAGVPATLVHPDAVVGSSAVVGQGTIICGGVQISTNVALGMHVHVNPNATIGHDAISHDFVSINPGAIVSGEVAIGECALVGAGAVVLQGLRVGANSVVGASACAVRDVLDHTTVKGVPAR